MGWWRSPSPTQDQAWSQHISLKHEATERCDVTSLTKFGCEENYNQQDKMCWCKNVHHPFGSVICSHWDISTFAAYVCCVPSCVSFEIHRQPYAGNRTTVFWTLKSQACDSTFFLTIVSIMMCLLDTDKPSFAWCATRATRVPGPCLYQSSLRYLNSNVWWSAGGSAARHHKLMSEMTSCIQLNCLYICLLLK